ncbi:MAG TPA: hypothetical protein PK657_14570 [Legionella sp.]|nr:hypothetical protein [Legionella sp.]
MNNPNETNSDSYISPEIQAINDLKKLARTYIESHNELVKKKWQLEIALTNNFSPDKEREKQLIDQAIYDSNYENKINELLNELKKLEIKLYGKSDICGTKPYKI